MDDVIVVDGLRKDYGSVQAVAGLTFTVRRGEVFGLLGPNGAGKTTTLNLIAGELPPSAGKIFFKGHEGLFS